MPVHKVEIDSQEIRIWTDANTQRVFLIAGVVAPDSQEKADAIAEYIQENWFDHRVLLNTLSPSHPDRLADPGLPHYFWDGDGTPASTDLVSRSILFTCIWDGVDYQPRMEQIVPE